MDIDVGDKQASGFVRYDRERSTGDSVGDTADTDTAETTTTTTTATVLAETNYTTIAATDADHGRIEFPC